MKCPFYQIVHTEGPLRKVKGYCNGYQSKKLRIPSTYEEENLCLTKNYHRCQVFNTRMKEEEKVVLSV